MINAAYSYIHEFKMSNKATSLSNILACHDIVTSSIVFSLGIISYKCSASSCPKGLLLYRGGKLFDLRLIFKSSSSRYNTFFYSTPTAISVFAPNLYETLPFIPCSPSPPDFPNQHHRPPLASPPHLLRNAHGGSPSTSCACHIYRGLCPAGHR